ncbi:MAG TPA: hypothetical protein VGJ70_17270 [Solirubrobacteraceae bacterium]|jgi:hypothetical protein
MSAPPALDAVAEAAARLHAAEEAQRDAICAAFDSGASLRQIAKKALLSHEQVRRIIRHRQRDSVAPYLVTVERRGVSPLETQLLVRAPSKRAAGELAACIAERKRGGTFEATKVRRAPRDGPLDYDDAES